MDRYETGSGLFKLLAIINKFDHVLNILQHAMSSGSLEVNLGTEKLALFT